MAGVYDVELNSIELVSLKDDFSEVIGSDYEIVGGSAMPGPPRPLGIYRLSIPIHGDAGEANPYPIGDTQRAALRSLFQNDALRFQGVDFQTTFDSQINGWIVLGSGEISYAPGGPTFGEYTLNFSAAHIGAQQVLLLAQQISFMDLREEGQTPDILRTIASGTPQKGKAIARHYLPVGAYDIVGQTDPVIPELHEYQTIHGKGHYVDDRQHGELVTFELEPEDVHKGDVRVWSPSGGNPDWLQDGSGPVPEWGPNGDRRPQDYGWGQVFGTYYPFARREVPILDNGRCRVRHVEGGTLVVDVAKDGRYELEAQRIALGYPDLIAATLVEVMPQRAVMQLTVSSARGRALVFVTLQQGWPGPEIQTYAQGAKSPLTIDGDAAVHEHEGWKRLRVNTPQAEAMIQTRVQPRLIRRF